MPLIVIFVLMDSFKKAYWQMHIATLLFGFTAILGALIDLSAVLIVWWRVLLTTVSLLFFVRLGRTLAQIEGRDLLRFCGIGILVGLHWIAFYGSIKLANSSIALICMAFTAFFTSLIEPLLNRRSINKVDVGLGLVIIPAMAFVVHHTKTDFYWGIVAGLVSALLAALFSTLNKKYLKKADSYTITFIELGAATIFLTILLPIYLHYSPGEKFWPPSMIDWVYIIILALVCTTLAYVLALRSLSHLSAFYSTLIINLEPIYGILLAILILNDHQDLSPSFYVGCMIILITIIAYPEIKGRVEMKPNRIKKNDYP